MRAAHLSKWLISHEILHESQLQGKCELNWHFETEWVIQWLNFKIVVCLNINGAQIKHLRNCVPQNIKVSNHQGCKNGFIV